MELWVTLAKEAPAQLDLTSFRLFDHVIAWKPVGDPDQGGAARRTGVWRDFRVIPGRWQRGQKVFPLRVR
jgi:hypothetical protein